MAMASNAVVFVILLLCCLGNIQYMSNADSRGKAGFRAHMKRLHPRSPNITTQQHLRGAVQRSIARILKIESSIASAIASVTSPSSSSSSSSSSASPQAEIEAPVSIGSGEYVVTMSIGSPPAKMVAIVDTGSDLIWTQCQPCTSCFAQPDPIFDPFQSTTYTKVPCTATSLCSSLPQSSCTPDCEYSYGYVDGSKTSGVLSTETLTLSDTSGGQYPIPRVAFGCSYAAAGFPNTDGLVGLGRGALSLISQLGSLVESKFSYCLISGNSSASETSPLLFGSAASVGEGAKSTPMVTNPAVDTFYYLSLEGISVGNSLANIPAGTFDIKGDGRGGFIIDSGAEFTYLTHAAFTALADSLNSAIGLPRADNSDFSLCYQLPSGSANRVTVPDITFHFGKGADYVITGKYTFRILEDANLLCLLMLDSGEGESSMGTSTLGNTQQQNYHIVYDNANQKLSFAPADCASL